MLLLIALNISCFPEYIFCKQDQLVVAERLTFFPHTSMTSSNGKLGECVRWGGGGGVVGSEW